MEDSKKIIANEIEIRGVKERVGKIEERFDSIDAKLDHLDKKLMYRLSPFWVFVITGACSVASGSIVWVLTILNLVIKVN